MSFLISTKRSPWRDSLMKTVMLTTLARLPPARFNTWSICENTCLTCASKLLAMSLPALSRVAVCPATQTILPPSVTTPGENARESWNGVFSMYSAAASGIEMRASRSPAGMRFMVFSLELTVSVRSLLFVPFRHVGEVDFVPDVLRSRGRVDGLLHPAEGVGELDAQLGQLDRIGLDHRRVVGPEKGPA